MKKFQFSLETVLRYKQQILDSRQNEYAAAMARVREQEAELARRIQAHRDLNREFRQAEAEGITIADAMGYETGLRVLEARIAEAEARLEALRAEAEECRARLIAARQDTASLEKLREHKLEGYNKLLRKQDEQFIDELVSTQRVMSAGQEG